MLLNVIYKLVNLLLCSKDILEKLRTNLLNIKPGI